MERESAVTRAEASYGELLGEYFSIVAEIAPLLDESGRPKRDRIEEYDRLRNQKEELQSTLDSVSADHDTTDVESIFDAAFSKR